MTFAVALWWYFLPFSQKVYVHQTFGYFIILYFIIYEEKHNAIYKSSD